MTDGDRTPSRGTPSYAMIAARSNNRLGAVYAALHSFWMARQAAVNSSGSGTRRDAYSVLLYESTATQTSIMNDFDHTPDQLLQELLPQTAKGGTDFAAALILAQTTMETHWSTERSVGHSDNAITSAHIRTKGPDFDISIRRRMFGS
jgi:hypothetical protein